MRQLFYKKLFIIQPFFDNANVSASQQGYLINLISIIFCSKSVAGTNARDLIRVL